MIGTSSELPVTWKWKLWKNQLNEFMNNISKGEQLKKSIGLLNWLDRDNNGETQENNLIWAHLDKLIDKWVKVRVGTNWTGEVEMNRIADQRNKAMNWLMGLFV